MKGAKSHITTQQTITCYYSTTAFPKYLLMFVHYPDNIMKHTEFSRFFDFSQIQPEQTVKRSEFQESLDNNKNPEKYTIVCFVVMLLLFCYFDVSCLSKHTCESLRQYWRKVWKVCNGGKFICFVLERLRSAIWHAFCLG